MFYSHRRMLDDNGQPVKAGARLNTQRKRKYYVKDLDRGVEWMRIQMHRYLHPEAPELSNPSQSEKAQSRSNQRRREKRTRGRAETHK